MSSIKDPLHPGRVKFVFIYLYQHWMFFGAEMWTMHVLHCIPLRAGKKNNISITYYHLNKRKIKAWKTKHTRPLVTVGLWVLQCCAKSETNCSPTPWLLSRTEKLKLPPKTLRLRKWNRAKNDGHAQTRGQPRLPPLCAMLSWKWDQMHI